MAETVPDTEELLRMTAKGDAAALQLLLGRHRDRLRLMVAIRLDRRLAPRIDPSDVVQEALADASRKLDDYLRDRPLPFYPWLRRLACERIVQLHRHHIRSRKRAVIREERLDIRLPDDSASRLVDRLAAVGTSPDVGLARDEQRLRLLELLDQLAPNDREVLVMYYLEGLAFKEVAAVLGITENAAKVRHFRALERVRKRIEGTDGGVVGR